MKHILKDQTYTTPISYSTAAGKAVFSTGVQGSVLVNGKVLVSQVQHVPDAPVSLVSVGDILTTGKDVWFNHRDRTACIGKLSGSHNDIIDCKINESQGTWKVRIGGDAIGCAFLGNGKPSAKDMNLWHSRFMHVSPPIIQRTAKVVHGLQISKLQDNDAHCEPCIIGKMHELPYGSSRERGGGILSNVSVDIFFPGDGQIGHRGVTGMLGVNVHNTQLRLAYPVKKRSETVGLIKFVKAFLERTTGEKLLKFYFDSAGENRDTDLLESCRQCGIQVEYTCMQAHNQNGEIDGWFRATLDMVRSNIHETGVPKYLWPETFLCAVYIWNRTSHGMSHGVPVKTPYELTFKRQPSLRDLRVPNCLAYVHVKDSGKLNPRASRGRFIGYANPDGHAKIQRGYEIMLYPSGKVVVSRDVYFVEHQFNLKSPQLNDDTPIPITCFDKSHDDDGWDLDDEDDQPNVQSRSIASLEGITEIAPAGAGIAPEDESADEQFDTPEGSEHADDDVDDPEPLRRSTRERRPPDRFIAGMAIKTIRIHTANFTRVEGDFITDLTPITLYVDGVAMLTGRGPANIRQALLIPEWAEAIQKELKQYEDMGSWTLVDYTGQHLLNTIWVLTRKHIETTNPIHKARLVIDGSKQITGEFDKVFASTPYRESVKFFQAVCTEKQMDMSKGDVTGAYHNSKCDKDIFVKPPIGMVMSQQDQRRVLKLINGVYGIKQGARLWQDTRNQRLEEYGFTECPGAACLFQRKASDGSLMLMIWHTDDGVLGCENNAETMKFWNWLGTKMTIKWQMGVGEWGRN